MIDEGYCFNWCRQNRIDCPRCGYLSTRGIVGPTKGPHYAQRECPQCGRHLGYIPQPASDRRPAAHRNVVAKLGIDHCQMCRRERGQLKRPDTLHGHHVEPYAEGGEPTRENTWVLCTACHRLVEWSRTYLNRTEEAV